MYRLHANGVFLDVLERDQVTSGSAKVFKCRFTFDGPYWDDLNRTAVFRAYNPRSQAAVEVIREVALDRDGLCEIPWEVTKTKNRLLAVGVYGTKTDGTILPTIWVDLDEILPGATAGEATKPPTPDKYQQFVQQVQADADRSEAAAGRAAQSAGRAEDAASQAAKAARNAKDTLGVVEDTASKALTDIESGKHTALESITHQKEDALSAVSQAQTDATGAVHTAQQEAVAAITHTGAAQTRAVTRAGEQAVQEVDAAAQAGVESVEQAQKTATQAVQTAATAAIQRVEQTGSTQVQAVEAAAAEKLEGINAANAHAPQPNPATGKWQVWDTESGQYMDTAVPYQGGHYIPTVAENGTLTWTGSQPDMPALPSANIRGPQGLGVPTPSTAAAGKVPTVTAAGDRYQLTGPYAPLASALRPTAKGNPAVCNNSIAWGFQGLKVYGKSVQNGTPTPENPVPIVSAGKGGKIAIEVRDSATTSQTLTLSTPSGLPGIPVDSGGNYVDGTGQQRICDVVDLGALNSVQNVMNVQLNGTEAVHKFLAINDSWFYFQIESPKIQNAMLISSSSWYKVGLSNYFKIGNPYSTRGSVMCALEQGGKSIIRVGFEDLEKFADASDVQNWLKEKYDSGNPVVLLYQAATPITTPLSAEEVDACRALQTYAGTTVVSTVEPVAGLEVKYVADATNAIIDDTAITLEKTWSSKGIVDVLCPPIQATGNPVVCYPVEGYPLGVTVDFAPIQEGEGDPSPENVRPIKARESVEVVRCGENLLNPELNLSNTYTPYGLTITYVGDNRVHLQGTYTETGGSFVILDSNQNLLAGRGLKITGFTVEGTKQKYSLYGLRTKNETVIAMSAQFTKGDAIDMTVAVVVSSSQVPTTYSSYTGLTATLTLPTPCYGGKLDAVTGKGQETWHTIVLTGQESSHIFEKLFCLNIGNNPKPKDLTSGRSSHYKYTTYSKGCIGVTKDGASAVLGAEGQFTIDEAGLSAWKSYLAAQYAAGTPVQIAYKVATPTPITATGGKPIPALAGVNTLMADSDSLTVTGREDIVHALAEMSRSVTQNAQVVDAMLGISPLAEGKNDQKGE